jgi:hypothetical protein
MDIIASVIDLCKEKDELQELVDKYEGWFSDLIGETVTIAVGSRRHRKFLNVTIESFNQDGWKGRDENGNNCSISFYDLIQTAAQ